MFYSWNVTLTAKGARLAASCLLEHLQSFRSRQLATFGNTAVPLLTSCVITSNGRFTGICIRNQPKGSPDGRQIEGPADPSHPVVLIDDSISSGRSMLSGIAVLEAKGFEVEGVVCLVNFPNRGGTERLNALGYRVDTIFDIWDDVGAPRPVYVPGCKRAGNLDWSDEPVPDGLHPATAARLVAERYLETGICLRPPHRFDAVYDGRGGAWVSFRERVTDYRVGREGFWHFDPGDSEPCRDLVLATVKAVRLAKLEKEHLARLKIGVTFFGPLEKIKPSGLDFGRYGIVVKSLSWETKVGGALPNTQVFTSEQEQYGLALRNGSIGAFEPHDLYRHEIFKCIEPGETWLPYGAENGPEYAWTADPEVGLALTWRARQALAAAVQNIELHGDPLSKDLIPEFAGVVVSLYRNGVIGCATSGRSDLDEAVLAATRAASLDRRFQTEIGPEDVEQIFPAVSILHDPEWLGRVSSEKAARKLRLGLDSLLVREGERCALFLDCVGPQFNWDKAEFVRRLRMKGGIESETATWTTYRTSTWLTGAEGAHRHVFGFADTELNVNIDSVRAEIALLGSFLAANIEPGGLPIYALEPCSGYRWESGSAGRLLHALGALRKASEIIDRPDWRRLADQGLEQCVDAIAVDPATGTGSLDLPGQRCGPMSDCELLAVAGCGDRPPIRLAPLSALAGGIKSLLLPDGSIGSLAEPVRMRRDNDFLPGAVLLALSAHAVRAGRPEDVLALEPYSGWQLNRFRNVHSWGQAGWLPQAWAAMDRAHGDHADSIFEVADWCIDRQVEATGAFLTDLNPDGPSFHTAFIAEGIAEAWSAAVRRGDSARADRYRASWERAMRLMRRLVIREADAPCLPDPGRSVGGVRGTLTSSTVRIDYVSHALMALAMGLEVLEQGARRKA